MKNVKGCSIVFISRRTMKAFDKGNMVISDGLKDELSIEMLKEIVAEKDGRVYGMIKKIDGVKHLLGVSVVKKVPFEISANSVDSCIRPHIKYVEKESYFDSQYKDEKVYFDENMVKYFKNEVGMALTGKAEYNGVSVDPVESVDVCGVVVNKTVLFIIITLLFAIIFHDILMGLLMGMGVSIITSACFVKVTAKDIVEEKSL
ncbi:MAG: hypothetical protein IKS48_01925 [Eubacterium sp.]|nr:hypothetical protein [Eubacterium sp.]